MEALAYKSTLPNTGPVMGDETFPTQMGPRETLREPNLVERARGALPDEARDVVDNLGSVARTMREFGADPTGVDMAMAAPLRKGAKLIPEAEALFKAAEDFTPPAMRYGIFDTVEKLPNKFSGEQLRGTLSGKVTKDELQYGKIEEFIASHPNATKDELKQHLEESLPKLEQKTLKGPANQKDLNEGNAGLEEFGPPHPDDDLGFDSQFHKYQIPEGTNYRENLTTLNRAPGPQKQAYEDIQTKMSAMEDKFSPEYRALQRQSLALDKAGDPVTFTGSHHGVDNLMFHTRTKDIGNSHYIDEMQSDWHQKGREQGYLGPEIKARRPITQQEFDTVLGGSEDGIHGDLARPVSVGDHVPVDANNQVVLSALKADVPDAPFKKNWEALSLKQEIARAISEGKDSVKWSNGKIQAERWGGGEIDKVSVGRTQAVEGNPNKYVITMYRNGRQVAMDATTESGYKEMLKQFGADITTDRIGTGDQWKLPKPYLYEGGSGGLAKFYDEKLVNVANDILKKHGGKVTMEPTKVYKATVERSLDDGMFSVFRDKKIDGQDDMNGRLERGFKTKKAAEKWIQDNPQHFMENLPTIHLTPEIKKSMKATGFKISKIDNGEIYG